VTRLSSVRGKSIPRVGRTPQSEPEWASPILGPTLKDRARVANTCSQCRHNTVVSRAVGLTLALT
jgi:hypothetical protein